MINDKVKDFQHAGLNILTTLILMKYPLKMVLKYQVL